MKLSNRLACLFSENGVIAVEDQEVYAYGLDLIFADILNYCLIMLLSFLVRRPLCGVLFLLCFCIPRNYCGGFHAKTYWLCRTTFLGVYVIILLLSHLLQHAGLLPLLLGDLFALLIVARFAPIRHPNKELSLSQRRRNHHIALVLSAVVALASLVLWRMDAFQLAQISTWSIVAVSILMLIGYQLYEKGR